MPIRVEAYTLEGILTGVIAWPGHLRDALENRESLPIEEATLAPLDGSRPAPPAELQLVVDDVVLAVPDEEMTGPVHAAWHAIRLEAGPYEINGELATMPGFDPGRALTRPTGEFVLLRDVRIGLLEHPEIGQAEHPQGLVNRYTVDAVEADLMLGFFFPGATMIGVLPDPVVHPPPPPPVIPRDAAEAGPGEASTEDAPTEPSAAPPTPAA
jgi:hypothetical protein